jgi:hypothetical protein
VFFELTVEKHVTTAEVKENEEPRDLDTARGICEWCAHESASSSHIRHVFEEIASDVRHVKSNE